MEYTVVITKDPNSPWRAVVPALAHCEAEAETRDEVVERIKEAIAQMPQRHIEVVKIEVPDADNLARLNGNLKQAEEDPILKFAGIFRDDPYLDELFDEIERRRDAHRVGG
jgi:predicted RNase H-like HicB family nuclease